MLEYKVLIGIVAVALAALGYYFYIRDIFSEKTKPHAFTWLVWTFTVGIVFVGQVSGDGGPGAWVTGISALIVLFIFILSLKKGERHITNSDKWSLLGAGIALALWYITSDLLTSIILVTIIDIFGWYPTFRKSYVKPYDETLVYYLLAGLKFILSLIALENYNLLTYLYPVAMIIMNASLVAFLIMRRNSVGKFKKTSM